VQSAPTTSAKTILVEVEATPTKTQLGLIVGPVGGGCAVLLITLGIWLFIRRRRLKKLKQVGIDDGSVYPQTRTDAPTRKGQKQAWVDDDDDYEED